LRKASGAKKSPKAKRRAVKKAPPRKARPTVKPTKRIPGAKKVPPRKVPPGKAPGKKAPVAEGRHAKKVPAAMQSRTRKVQGPQESPTKKVPVLPYEPYGPGSARVTPDGGGPAGWLVKGRSDTRHYYTPDDPTYGPTVAQVWFKDEESAV